jgi:hypothetical protein
MIENILKGRIKYIRTTLNKEARDVINNNLHHHHKYFDYAIIMQTPLIQVNVLRDFSPA